jgi:hypothetical protein
MRKEFQVKVMKLLKLNRVRGGNVSSFSGYQMKLKRKVGSAQASLPRSLQFEEYE